MAKLDGLETVLDFLKGLQPKIAAQIAQKELLSADSKSLKGSGVTHLRLETRSP